MVARYPAALTRRLAWIALGAALASTVACTKKQEADKSAPAETRAAGGDFAAVTLKPGAGELRALLAAEAGKAKAKGLRPFVEIGATWCGPCQKLEAGMGDPQMVDAFKGTYQIKLDADAWGDELAGAGLRANAIPIFFELDEGGRPTGRTIDGGAWGEDVPGNMAPPLKAFFHQS